MLDEGSEQKFKNNSVIYNYKWKAWLKLEKEKEKICRSKIHSVLSQQQMHQQTAEALEQVEGPQLNPLPLTVKEWKNLCF